MQPVKNKAWTSPTLYLSEQTSPHWATVELPKPLFHSQDPGSSPQTLLICFSSSHPDPFMHRQPGSWSANIMTMVWKASSAHARLVKMKCLNCQNPNSPQYCVNMSSMQSFWGLGLDPGPDSHPGSLDGLGSKGEFSEESWPLGSDPCKIAIDKWGASWC